ncbi:MAG: hypothetical protein N2C14_01045, partial [Planctomycetales bacterium]
RETRLKVDPTGFEVAVEGRADYREEKIDLPPGWLRGFMQLQGAMGLPMRKASLSRDAVYSLLAWLKRHKAKTSPRAIRFDLVSGQSPTLTLEPWEKEIVSRGTQYDGPPSEAIRIWGRRRLLVLSRLLPLADGIDVYLLGTGMPSFWVVRMGEMRFTLGLSGWTANDWTRGSALDLLAPPAEPTEQLIGRAARLVREQGACSFEEIQKQTSETPADCAAALRRLAHSGQVIYDLAAARYRWRQVTARALGESEIGPENPELVESRVIAKRSTISIVSRQEAPGGGDLLKAKVEGCPVDLLIDADGLIKRGTCVCGHYKKYGLRNGPCRHMLALRARSSQGETDDATDAAGWYDKLVNWSGGKN